MGQGTKVSESFDFYPLTPPRWKDFEKLFGERGACGGCWCMWWRLSHREFVKGKGRANRASMKKIVHSGKAPGIIAYIKGEPAGWCSIAPREEFVRLLGSRILKPVDDKEAWSIVCLFMAKKHRRQGFSSKLLKSACIFAAEGGAKIIEGYPNDIKNKLPDPFVYTGLASAYRKAGFKEVLRRSKSRPIMRKVVSK